MPAGRSSRPAALRRRRRVWPRRLLLVGHGHGPNADIALGKAPMFARDGCHGLGMDRMKAIASKFPVLRFFAGWLAVLALAGCGLGAGGPGSGTIKIAEARALPEGHGATIEGHITAAPGGFNSFMDDQGFVLQDESGGVYISLAERLDIILDQRVQVTGKLSRVAEMVVLETAAPDVRPLRRGAKTAAPLTVSTGDVGEATESILVRVHGRLTQPVGDDSPYGMKVFIDDGSGETQVFVALVAGMPLVDLSGLAVGQAITVVGVGARYETTWEVLPRRAEDLSR